MKFCCECILPDSRPQLEIQANGVCTACEGAKEKKVEIDWSARRVQFEKLCEDAKRNKRGIYDCMVPVSGGKDSTWQVYTMKHEFDMKVLAVTWRPPCRTELGKRNLENLISIGVDHIDFSVNPQLESRFVLKTFESNGSPSLAEHMGLFSIPLKVAIAMQVPLVIWGENSGLEFGGNLEDRSNYKMGRDWLSKYGVTNNTFMEDWICEDLPEREMQTYAMPDDKDLEQADILATFLGWFLPWDPFEIANKARSHGFEWAEKPPMGIYPFSDLDAPFIIIHHFMKWYKFGFTRLWDNLTQEIRSGRMSRQEAVDYVNNNPEQVPWAEIEQFCKYTGITQKRFFEICESHRNPEIWKRDDKGQWFIPELVEIFSQMPPSFYDIPQS